jgi:Na+/proline symporter
VLILILYLAFIVAFTFLQKKEWLHPVFKSSKKVSWVVSGLSLYMLYLSVDQGQLLTGIISQYGMQGLWIVWAGWLGTFVVPLVFAPLWQKMDFMTDNQFLLFRFPGKSGRILHLFRAIYVGGLVVSLSLCFHVLGFARVLQTYFEIDPKLSLALTGLVLCLFALKNVLDLKLKMDAFHAVIYFFGLTVILFSLWKVSNGWNGLFSFFENQPHKKQLLPNSTDSNAWFSLVVFLGVQWWSSYLFDGGGPEMARYTAVKDKKNALLSGLVPIGISFILSFFIIGHILLVLGLSSENGNQEIQYVEQVFGVVPEALKSIVLLGFFGMFITTAESLMNWGASFLTLDAYKMYIQPKASEKRIRVVSFAAMLLLSLLSLVFAWQIESLQSLVKITFSMAAGVAPVYILRWIWFRINAWSQLAAMISSALFTLLYPGLHEFTPFKDFPMEESRVLAVTILTTFIWLVVTFITPNQQAEVRLQMMPILESRKVFVKRFAIALILGLIFLVITAGFWWWILS